MTENKQQRPILIASFFGVFRRNARLSRATDAPLQFALGKIKGRSIAEIAYATARISAHQYTNHDAPLNSPDLNLRRRPILQAIQHQLDARRNAELVENAKEIIAHRMFAQAHIWPRRFVRSRSALRMTRRTTFSSLRRRRGRSRGRVRPAKWRGLVLWPSASQQIAEMLAIGPRLDLDAPRGCISKEFSRGSSRKITPWAPQAEGVNHQVAFARGKQHHRARARLQRPQLASSTRKPSSGPSCNCELMMADVWLALFRAAPPSARTARRWPPRRREDVCGAKSGLQRAGNSFRRASATAAASHSHRARRAPDHRRRRRERPSFWFSWAGQFGFRITSVRGGDERTGCIGGAECDGCAGSVGSAAGVGEDASGSGSIPRTRRRDWKFWKTLSRSFRGDRRWQLTRDCSTMTWSQGIGTRFIDGMRGAAFRAGAISRAGGRRRGEAQSAAHEEVGAQGDRLMVISRMHEATAFAVALGSAVALVPLVGGGFAFAGEFSNRRDIPKFTANRFHGWAAWR